MLKLKIAAVITIILGIISLVWIFYDYMALTDIVYKYGQDLDSKRRIVTLGFIPVILFHFAFFYTMLLLFGFLKTQKPVIKEHARIKAEDLKTGRLKAEERKIEERKAEERKAEERKTGQTKPEGPKPDSEKKNVG